MENRLECTEMKLIVIERERRIWQVDCEEKLFAIVDKLDGTVLDIYNKQ